MALLNQTLKTVLERAKYTREYTDIPNNHPALASERDNLKAIAEAIGIDWEKAQYTFTVCKKPGQELAVYQPYLAASNGVPTLFWGQASLPLSECKVDVSFEGEKFTKLWLSSTDFDVELSMMVAKDQKPSVLDIRRAWRQGTLGTMLSEVFCKPKKLNEVKPGTYNVIGYESRTYKGDVKYVMTVEGVGVVSCNTTLNLRFSENPEVSKDAPAILEVKPSTRKTNQGHPIIPVSLTTKADSELPVFDFGSFDDADKSLTFEPFSFDDAESSVPEAPIYSLSEADLDASPVF
jgi:hypothetical protein